MDNCLESEQEDVKNVLEAGLDLLWASNSDISGGRDDADAEVLASVSTLEALHHIVEKSWNMRSHRFRETSD